MLLALHRTFAGSWSGAHVVVRRAATFLAVAIGWVLFRSTNFRMAWTLLTRMFHYEAGGLMPGWIGLVAMLIVAAAIAHCAPNTFEIRHEWHPAWSGALAAAYILCLIAIAGAKASPFLYFQF